MFTDSELLDIIEGRLAAYNYRAEVPALYDPVKFTLSSGGKRLRPLLCLRACQAAGSLPSAALNQAVAIEMFHNFTLIHDDVMDNSVVRRGKPTVFARWGATQAILSGDALLTIATNLVADAPAEVASQILGIFTQTALEVYEGQQLDMDFENRDDVTVDEYLEMIRLKTSVLLGCACKLGAMVGANSRSPLADALYNYGEKLGLAFQLRDDWLDSFGNSANFGKAIGGDIKNRKKTWLFISAMSERPFEMHEALSSSDDDKIVGNVIRIYNDLNLSERCDALIDRYCRDAIHCVDAIDIDAELKAWFTDLALSLCKREK